MFSVTMEEAGRCVRVLIVLGIVLVIGVSGNKVTAEYEDDHEDDHDSWWGE